MTVGVKRGLESGIETIGRPVACSWGTSCMGSVSREREVFFVRLYKLNLTSLSYFSGLLTLVLYKVEKRDSNFSSTFIMYKLQFDKFIIFLF